MRSLLKTFALAALILFALPASTQAWTNNRLMDDNVFDNAHAMSEQAIRDFINAQPGTTCLKSSGAIFPEPQGYFDYGPNNVDAARVIYVAAQKWGINPQVIIATLQKEQTLITDNDCVDPYGYATLPKAMGMGCFEGPNEPCPRPEYDGFSRQVMKGSWQLKFNKERAVGNVMWNSAEGDQFIDYPGPYTEGNRKNHVNASLIYRDGYWPLDGQNTYLETGATASLYRYTPHLGQSFPRIFEEWFGSPTPSSFLYKSSSSPEIYIVVGAQKFLVPDFQVMEAYGQYGKSVAIVDQTYLNGLDSGPSLTTVAKKEYDPNGTIFLLNKGAAYPLSAQNCTDWGIDCFNINVTKTLPNRLLDQLTRPDGPLPVMFENWGTVYKPDGGSKRPVLDERTVNAHGGWAVVRPMQDRNAAQPVGTLLLSNNTLIKFSGNPAIYLYDGGALHAIPGPEEFNAWKLSADSVVHVIAGYQTGLSTGSNLTTFATDNGGKKYLIDGGRKILLEGREADFSAAAYTSSFAQNQLGALPTVAVKPVFRSGSGAIFTIYQNQRYVFPTPEDFSGLGFSAAQIENISDFNASQFSYAAMHLGPGRLFKISGSDDLLVTNGSSRLRIPSPNFFGYFNLPTDKVITVDSATGARYGSAGELTVSFARSDGKRFFTAAGLSGAYAVPAAQQNHYGIADGSFIALVPQITNRLPELRDVTQYAKSPSGEIYYIVDGQKRHIQSPSGLSSVGANTGNTLTLPAELLNTIPNGPAIP